MTQMDYDPRFDDEITAKPLTEARPAARMYAVCTAGVPGVYPSHTPQVPHLTVFIGPSARPWMNWST
jgi:hypothetical protein